LLYFEHHQFPFRHRRLAAARAGGWRLRSRWRLTSHRAVSGDFRPSLSGIRQHSAYSQLRGHWQFYADRNAGALFEVLSADASNSAKLERRLHVNGSRFTYAVGSPESCGRITRAISMAPMPCPRPISSGWSAVNQDGALMVTASEVLKLGLRAALQGRWGRASQAHQFVATVTLSYFIALSQVFRRVSSAVVCLAGASRVAHDQAGCRFWVRR
jgi:hypothetical protein